MFLIEPFEAVPTFVEAARIDAATAGLTLDAGDQFGFDVAADGISSVAIGAPRDDDGASNAGAAYVFNTSDTVAPLSYTLVDKVDPSLPGIDYLFGAVVDIEAGFLAVGAPQEDTNAGSSNFAGAGYGFELVAGNYVEQVRTATEFGTSGGNSWGSAIALSGDYLVVGVAGQDSYRLAGRVLSRSGSTWLPLEDLLFPDERQNAAVGGSLAVGVDGTVVTGAPTHDNLNGRDAGAAYVLQLPDAPENPVIALTVAPDSPTAQLSISTIELADLPPSAFQGYGGAAADYAVSSLQTLDLRSDVVVGGEPTPVAAVTIGELGLDGTPVTRSQLDAILLSELPVAGAGLRFWRALRSPASRSSR